MNYLTEVSKIIDYGMNSNPNKLLSQVQLLIKNLQEDGDMFSANALEQVLKITKKSIKPQSNINMFERPVPVEKDSRFPLADKNIYKKNDIWIELPNGTKEIIERFINYYENKDKLIENDIPINSTILLYGPPGTGKTKTASYIASMLGLPLITARTDALISSYLGSTSKNIRMLMDYAQATPCVLFLDEFDALAKVRDDANEIGELKRVVVTLLQNIDSLENIVLIAATNHEKLLDKAVWRRFHYKIEISLPNSEVRKNITKRLLKKFIDDKKTLETFCELTEGMSGADIETICYEFLKEKTIVENVKISRLLFLAVIENLPELKMDNMTKKQIILLIKKNYNLSYEKISQILDVSKTYVAKVVKDSKDGK